MNMLVAFKCISVREDHTKVQQGHANFILILLRCTVHVYTYAYSCIRVTFKIAIAGVNNSMSTLWQRTFRLEISSDSSN